MALAAAAAEAWAATEAAVVAEATKLGLLVGRRASAVAELLKRTDEELSALSSRGACPPDVRAHYDATVRHVAHQRERGDAVGARYRDLPET